MLISDHESDANLRLCKNMQCIYFEGHESILRVVEVSENSEGAEDAKGF